jgi:hypothetical protein
MMASGVLRITRTVPHLVDVHGTLVVEMTLQGREIACPVRGASGPIRTAWP